MFASMSYLQNMNYEFSKATHSIASLVFILFFFFIAILGYHPGIFFVATGVIYTLLWLYSHMRIFFHYGVKTAVVRIVSNGFVKISVPMKDSWKAGQQYFIRVFGLVVHGLTTSPFTACSLPGSTRSSTNELVFYVRPQGGFTVRLARHAQQHRNASMKGLLNGPYGGINMRKVATSQNVIAIARSSSTG
jgi:predicted ferric reductase